MAGHRFDKINVSICNIHTPRMNKAFSIKHSDLDEHYIFCVLLPGVTCSQILSGVVDVPARGKSGLPLEARFTVGE